MKEPTFLMSKPESEGEYEAFGDIVHRSLFFPRLEDDNWLDREGREDIRVIRMDGQVVGGYSCKLMGQWFGQRSVPVGAVRAVAVAPEARGLGVSTKMLTKMLEALHEQKIPLACLYPSSQQVYRKVGFELAGVRYEHMIPSHSIEPHELRCQLRPVSPDDPEVMAILKQLYHQQASHSDGFLDRSDWVWDVRVRSSRFGPIHTYLLCQDGRPEGYVVYTQSFKESIVDGEIKVRDMILSTGDAQRSFLRFVRDQRSTIQRLYWPGGCQDPFFFSLPNPSNQTTMELRWLLRLVDVCGAIEQRGYRQGLDTTLHLQLLDDILPWNQGRFICRVHDGKATIERGGEGHLTLDVRGLAAIYTGFLSAFDAQSIGLLSGESSAIQQLQETFAAPTPWMSDFF